MKSVKALIAAMLAIIATTASAQTSWVHITKNDNSVFHYSQAQIQSMIIDTKAPAAVEADYVEFTSGDKTVKVATKNLGATTVAESPETCYGDYYAWGATQTFGIVDRSTGTVTPTKTGGYSQANAPYNKNGAYTAYINSGEGKAALTELEAEDDAVAANMPGWHMPTQSELQTLYEACGGFDSDMPPTGTISADQAYPTTAGIYWVTGGNAAVKIGDDTYSVNGMLFVQDATHHVFFPATGNVDGTVLYNVGEFGGYWSSSLYTYDTVYACSLACLSNVVDLGSRFDRYQSYPVRPFKDAE